MPRSRKAIFLASAIFIWSAVVLVGYYAFHRPFSPDFAARFFDGGGEILVALAITTVSGAMGTKLLPNLPVPALARLSLRAALGLGVLSVFYLMVGSMLGTSGWIAWVILLGLAFWLRGEMRTWGNDLRGLQKIWVASDGFGKGIALLGAVIFSLALLSALAPPLKFDSLVYHLSLPKQYLLQGRVAYVAENVFWGFPQLPHMLSTWSLALGASRGTLIGWAMGVLCVIGLIGHVADRLGTRAAWAAVAALLSGASLAASLGWGYVDWPSMLMGWGALFFLDQYLLKGQTDLVFLAGVFAGLAAGTKYTAAILIQLGVFVLMWHTPRFRPAGIFIVGSLAAISPWLIKNLLVSGNPVYPLLFPGGAMDAFRIQALQGFPAQGSWLDALFLPFRATWFGIESARVATAPGYEGSLGPLLLGLGMFSMLGWGATNKKQRGLKSIAALVSIGGLVIWALAGRISGHLIRSHLYYSIFPAFTILAAFGFAAIDHIRVSSVRLGRVISALIVFVLALNIFQLDSESLNSEAPQFLTAQIGEQPFLENNLGLYALVMADMQDLPEDSKILMLWEPRSYYCLPICDPDELIDRWVHDLAFFEFPDDVFSAWRDSGYSHVLFYRLGASFVHGDPEHFRSFDLQQLESALSSLSFVKNYNGDYLLFSLGE